MNSVILIGKTMIKDKLERRIGMILSQTYLRMKSFMDNPMTVEEVLSIYKMQLIQQLLSKVHIQSTVIPELTTRSDQRLAIATIFYMLEGIPQVLRSRTYFPAAFKDTITECCRVAMNCFPVDKTPIIFRRIIDHINYILEEISKIEVISNPVAVSFKDNITTILHDLRAYFAENLQASVGYTLGSNDTDGDSTIRVANACISTLLKNTDIKPDEDLRQLVFMDIFDTKNNMTFVSDIGDAVGKMIVSMTDKSTNNILEGAKVNNESINEQVLNYLIEVKCAISNIASTAELCEKTNYDLECEMYKNITASEDCIGDVNGERFGWIDADIIAKGANNDGIILSPDDKVNDILSKSQITGKNLQFILGSVSLEKDDDKRKAIVEKLKNSLCETLRWEATHENYSDLPVMHFTKRTGQVLESLTKNTVYESRVHEAINTLTEAMNDVVREEAIPCTFNGAQANVLTLAPFPVGVRTSQQLVNNIWKAETDEDMDAAMLEFAKCYGEFGYFPSMESNAVSKKAREISRKSQNKTEKKIRNIGGTIHEVKQAAHNAIDPMEKYIGQMMEKAKKEDSARRREILIKGGVAPKVLRWIKRSIPLIAGAAVGTVVPAAAVISGISLIGLIASDKMLDEKEKRKLMRELEDEIQICNEKIDDSRGDENKQKKYELIRIRNNLKRTQDRIRYNLKE